MTLSIGNFKTSSKMSMYGECGNCGLHWQKEATKGEIKCPSCGSSDMERLEIGVSVTPYWFNETIDQARK